MDIRGFEVVSDYEDKNIQLPLRKTSESAGYDIESAVDTVVSPHQVVVVPTGIKAFMNYDEYLSIHVRSSVGIKRGLMLANNTGIIDSDYYNNEENEGHIMIGLYNYTDHAVEIKKGDRLAQGIFSKYLITSEDASNGIRRGGIGSTGV